MQNYIINCKMKEMYFDIHTIEESGDITKSRDLFWSSLNSLAAQNMGIQNIKTA